MTKLSPKIHEKISLDEIKKRFYSTFVERFTFIVTFHMPVFQAYNTLSD